MPGEGGPGAPHMVSAASCHGGFCIHPPWAVDKRTELLRSIKICSPSVRVLPSALPCTPSHPDSAVGWSQGKNTRTRSDEHLRNCRAKESPLSSGFPPQAAHPPSGIKPWLSHCGAVAAVWAEGHPQASERLHLQEECPRLKALRWWMHLPCKLYFCTTAVLAGSLRQSRRVSQTNPGQNKAPASLGRLEQDAHQGEGSTALPPHFSASIPFQSLLLFLFAFR